MIKHVIDADYELTGGCCYLYYGKFDDGTYFAFGLNNFAVFDADYSYVFTSEFYDEYEGDQGEWEHEHIIGEYVEYPDEKVNAYIKETFAILKRKYPKASELDMLEREELET